MKRHRLPFTADLTPFFDRLTMHLSLLLPCWRTEGVSQLVKPSPAGSHRPFAYHPSEEDCTGSLMMKVAPLPTTLSTRMRP
jgi:hypothetical protein